MTRPEPDRNGAAGTLEEMPIARPEGEQRDLSPDTLPDSRRDPRPGQIRQGDWDKAYRPLPLAMRRAAFEAALAAYSRGDFFATHEHLEPAWMGTDDLEERALHQGLIKVAAAYVHAVRGNPVGISKNLAGARRHLALAGPAGAAWGIDVPALLADIDARLDRPDTALAAPVIRRISPA
jgi:hypothetical protein